MGSTLAVELARHLDAAVPRPFSVTADEGSVIVSDGSISAATPVVELLDQDGAGPTADEVETATWAVLSAVQDAVSTGTAEPWPGCDALPLPGVELDDGVLRAWFGAAGSAVLDIGPIAVDLHAER